MPVSESLRVCPLDLELRDGRLHLTAAPRCAVELSGAAPRVRFRRGGDTVEWSAVPLRQVGDTLVADDTALGLRLELEVVGAADVCELRATLENTGATPVHVHEIAPLAVARSGEVKIGAGADRWSVLRNGYQSWSGTRAYDLRAADADPWWNFLRLSHTDVAHRAAGRRGSIRSDLFTAIKNMRSGEALCAGFTTSAQAFGAVRVEWGAGGARELSAVCDLDGVELAPGERVTSERLWLAAGFDEHELLERYAAALGAGMQARVVRGQPPLGWCSWYHYFTRVDEAAVLANVEALRRLDARWPADFAMVDDGWQRAVGDWDQPNAKFPRGMKWLAEQIAAAGMQPGLWLAPFIARPESEAFRAHPDWFVRGAGGARVSFWNPAWGLRDGAMALDTTHPGALDWLRKLGRTLARDWGYRVLKLDFLFAAALPGKRFDRRATRAEALRRGLEAFREGAGEDTFLLGCGCPLGPAVGLVDAMRIGPDVAPFWTSALARGPLRDRHGVATKNAIRNTLARAFLHRRLWLNDPDCLLVRDRKTRLGLEEIRSLVTAAALTDGMLVASDPMHELADDRLRLLERARELAGGRARVLDLFARDMPEEVLAENAGRRRLAVFNFSDRPARRSVDVGRFGICSGRLEELWTGETLGVVDGWVDLGTLPAHGVRILGLERDPTP